MGVPQDLCGFEGMPYAAWKGETGDDLYSFFNGRYWTEQRLVWTNQQTIPHVATSVGPSLCNWQGRLYAAWKGMNTMGAAATRARQHRTGRAGEHRHGTAVSGNEPVLSRHTDAGCSPGPVR